MCVQRFDDSLNSAIHITYRISLRSSSMPEPRDPLLKVLTYLLFTQKNIKNQSFGPSGGHCPEAGRRKPWGDPAEATIGNVHNGVWEL